MGGPEFVELSGVARGKQAGGCMGKYRRLNMIDPSADVGSHEFSTFPKYIFQNNGSSASSDTRFSCGKGPLAFLHFSRDEQTWIITESLSDASTGGSEGASRGGMLKLHDVRDIFLPALDMHSLTPCGDNGGRLVPLVKYAGLEMKNAVTRSGQDWKPWEIRRKDGTYTPGTVFLRTFIDSFSFDQEQAEYHQLGTLVSAGHLAAIEGALDREDQTGRKKRLYSIIQRLKAIPTPSPSRSPTASPTVRSIKIPLIDPECFAACM